MLTKGAYHRGTTGEAICMAICWYVYVLNSSQQVVENTEIYLSRIPYTLYSKRRTTAGFLFGGITFLMRIT